MTQHNIKVEEELESDSESVGSLADVFAKVLRHVNSPLEAHREACAVLQCVKETIIEQGGEQCETAYFGSLMSLLEKHKDEPENIKAVAASSYLLSLIFKKYSNLI